MPPHAPPLPAGIVVASKATGSDRAAASTTTTPGVPVVVDNLPDKVPVSAAELDAIETYLDHALREVLAGDSAGRDGKVP